MSRISTQRLNVRLALAAIAIVFLMAASVSAQTYSTLFTYPIDTRNDSGIFTPGIMSQGQDGNIYGTIVDDGSNGDGSAFKMTTSGEFTRIYAFCQLTGCVDGASPYGGLTLGRDGNLYGGAEVGGKNAFGTLFKLTPTGTLTTIWDFKGGTDTGYPLYPPFQGTDGNFYAAPNGSNGAGAVIKLTPTKAPPYLEKTLGNFIGTNGGAPAFPVQATDGNFYGAAFNGGSRGFGVVYKATPAGKLTVLHNFCTQTSCLDGASPIGALVQGEDGALYGVTYQGGAGNIGIFFKITTAGTFTLLHSFAGFSGSEPALPRSGLIVGSDGNFYGVTYAGGKTNHGTIYQLTPAGQVTTVYSFCVVAGCPDGFNAVQPVMQHTDGKFYGNTSGNSFGGAYFYQFDNGLAPFTRLLNFVGKVGATIAFLGQDFSSTSGVSFAGVPATSFTKVSDTYLTVKVPAGALTGTVTITTSLGTVLSSHIFLVTPQLKSFTPTSGAVGATVTLTGVSLTQATRVTIGGKSASFTVNSDTQVTATVPTGAKTGKISIATPGGSASAPGTFTVN